MVHLPIFLFLARRGDSSFGFWPFLIILVIVGGIFALSAYLEKKRAAAMRLVAEELRLQYQGEGAPDLIGRFPLGSRGHSRKLRNKMDGSAAGTDVAIFDYRYTIGHGKGSSHHSTTVACFRRAGANWPAFEMRPEGLFSKLGALFGGQDINFNTHPVFSKIFVLKGADEAAIRAMFDEPLLSALEEKKGLTVEGNGDELLIYRASRQVKPPLVRGLLEEAHGIYVQFADAAQRRG